MVSSLKRNNGLEYKSRKTNEDNTVTINYFNNENIQISSITYRDTIDYYTVGVSKYWYPDGKIKRIVPRDNEGNFDGELISYYNNGVVKRRDIYSKGELKSCKCYDSTGKESKYFPYEVFPEMDLALFNSCIQYPEAMRRLDIQEKVIIKVWVGDNDKAVKLQYDSHNSKAFIEEIHKCIKASQFKSAKIDGEPVGCWMTIPIKFSLQ